MAKQVKEVPKELQPYWTFREELTIEDGFILKGTRIVIPSMKCEAVLKLIHEGHLGLSKCKLYAKETVYWPGLNDQLDKLILNCELCIKYSQAKHKQPPNMKLGQEIPIHPQTKLATDLFHFEGESYLLVVDHKQISCCVGAQLNDDTTCGKSFQIDLLRIWMA